MDTAPLPAVHHAADIGRGDPFARFRLRRFFLGFVVILFFVPFGQDGSWFEVVSGWILSILILLLLHFQLRRAGIRWHDMVGPALARQGLLRALRLLPLLIGSSLAGMFLLGYPLAHFAPESLDSFLSLDFFVTAANPKHQAIYDGIILIEGVVVAPIMEEVLFRGVMLHRWATKWSVPTAVCVSSLLFGSLHAYSAIGATLFGFVMALLYLETGSLLVPILVHAANNALAFALDTMAEPFPALDFWRTAAEIRETPWLGILFVVAAGPPMYRYIRRHWPRTCAPMPYFRLHPLPCPTRD